MTPHCKLGIYSRCMLWSHQCFKCVQPRPVRVGIVIIGQTDRAQQRIYNRTRIRGVRILGKRIAMSISDVIQRITYLTGAIGIRQTCVDRQKITRNVEDIHCCPRSIIPICEQSCACILQSLRGAIVCRMPKHPSRRTQCGVRQRVVIDTCAGFFKRIIPAAVRPLLQESVSIDITTQQPVGDRGDEIRLK